VQKPKENLLQLIFSKCYVQRKITSFQEMDTSLPKECLWPQLPMPKADTQILDSDQEQQPYNLLDLFQSHRFFLILIKYFIECRSLWESIRAIPGLFMTTVSWGKDISRMDEF